MIELQTTKTFLPYILGTGVLSAVLAVIIGKWLDILIEKHKNKKDKDYAAIRLAIIFENYAIECSNSISRHEAEFSKDSHESKSWSLISIKNPELEKFPDDLNWKELDSGLLSTVLSYKNAIKLTEVCNYGNYFSISYRERLSELLEIIGYHGYRAWKLSKSLRKDNLRGWNNALNLEDTVEGFLKRYHDSAIKHSKKIARYYEMDSV